MKAKLDSKIDVYVKLYRISYNIDHWAYTIIANSLLFSAFECKKVIICHTCSQNQIETCKKKLYH